ncbi:MAG: TlpA disulfide reductase family protein [Verrucomicrobiota bacterium]
MRTGLILALALFMGLEVHAQRRGILNQTAPTWGADRWFQLEEGKTSLDVEDFKGKVVYLYCFQSWCPGCHSHGFPTLKKVSERFKDDEEVAFVTIQTVFEGFGVNSIDKAKATAEKYDLKIPVGHSGLKGKRSTLMKGYRTGGTPWTIIIDKEGVVRYNDFRIQAGDAIKLIEKLKETKADG